jgi:hypothetical protein
MKIVCAGLFLAQLAPLALTDAAICQPTMSWPEAVAPLAGGRTKAEMCVAVLKKVGKDSEIARGQMAYSYAKADSDAVIAGLIITLVAGGTPTDLPALQAKLASGISGLAEFCNSVNDILSATRQPGEKNVISELVKIVPIEPLMKAVSDGVATLYNNHRNDDALTRKTIQTQLEAARWPVFSEVKAAQ